MSKINLMEKIFRFLGNDANPTIIAAGIALAKGIFRPMFTMMDKKQEPEVKKYAAIREGLTEVIAIGVYTLSGAISNYMAKSMTRIKENLPKKDFPKQIFSNILKEKNLPATINPEKAASVAKTFFKFKSTISMLGVFLSAFLIIPAVCSLAMKPIMHSLKQRQFKDNKPNEISKVNIPQKIVTPYNTQGKKVSFASNNITRPQHNLRIGAL